MIKMRHPSLLKPTNRYLVLSKTQNSPWFNSFFGTPTVHLFLIMTTLEFIDFLKENYFISIYCIAWIVAVKTYRKYFDTALKYFPMLIAYTFFNELLGYCIRYLDDFAFYESVIFANDIIYNIYDIIFYGYFYLLYWRLIDSKKYKNIIVSLSISVLVIYMVSAFFQDPRMISLFYGTIYGSFVLVTIIILYFDHHMKTSYWTWKREKYNLVVWVSLGLLFFYSILPFLFLIGYLNNAVWEAYHLRELIRILIIVTYTIFCKGLLTSGRMYFR